MFGSLYAVKTPVWSTDNTKNRWHPLRTLKSLEEPPQLTQHMCIFDMVRSQYHCMTGLLATSPKSSDLWKQLVIWLKLQMGNDAKMSLHFKYPGMVWSVSQWAFATIRKWQEGHHKVPWIHWVDNGHWDQYLFSYLWVGDYLEKL